MGHSALVLKEANDFEVFSPQFLAESALRYKPDLVFLIDRLRTESTAYPSALPVVCWIQDELPQLSNPALIGKLGARDFTYAFSSAPARRSRALGYPHVGLLPFAANTELYFPGGVGPPDDRVAFITHLDAQRDPAWAPGMLHYLDGVLGPASRVTLDSTSSL